MNKMEIEYKDILANYLKPDEKVLWCGKPRVDFLLNFSEIGMNLFINLFLAVCVIIVELHDKQEGLSKWFFTGIFLLWILWSIFDYCFIKPHSLRNITYGLTNQRILLINDSKKTKLQAYHVDEIDNMRCNIKKNGVGNIDFKKYSSSIVFEYIENVERVYNQVQDVKKLKAN
jgi:hypothetical protein